MIFYIYIIQIELECGIKFKCEYLLRYGDLVIMYLNEGQKQKIMLDMFDCHLDTRPLNGYNSAILDPNLKFFVIYIFNFSRQIEWC